MKAPMKKTTEEWEEYHTKKIRDCDEAITRKIMKYKRNTITIVGLSILADILYDMIFR